MKKLIIFHHYNSSIGAGLSLLHILQSLNTLELNVEVCLPNIQGDLDKKIQEMGYNVFYSEYITPYMHFSGNHAPFFSIKHLVNCYRVKNSMGQIEKIISNKHPDYIAVNSMTLFWIGRIAQQCGAKAICFHRESYRKGLLGIRTNYIKKNLSRNFDVVAFLSNYDMNQTPKGSARYIRITDKVDVKKYNMLEKNKCRKSENLPKDSNLILYTGGMARLKGPEIIIKAIPLLKSENTKLIFLQYYEQDISGIVSKIKYYIKSILGQNIEFNIKHFIKKEGLKDKIIFKPATDHVENYFIACDVVVFPSLDAHQARPAYEAGIAKRPFIITDFPNTREFADQSNAWVFKRGDSKALACCIDEALSGKLKDKVIKNYEKTVKNNNLDTMREELLNLFKLVEVNRNDD